MIKIKSIFKCDSCKTINPSIVITEKVIENNLDPYKVDILILHINNKINKFFYEMKSITIKKRDSGKVKTYNYCGKCQSPIEEIKNKEDIKFLRNILRK